jgi:hypothetical protein
VSFKTPGAVTRRIALRRRRFELPKYLKTQHELTDLANPGCRFVNEKKLKVVPSFLRDVLLAQAFNESGRTSERVSVTFVMHAG